MQLINIKTGKKLDNIAATNVITYAFSPDEKETRLIMLGDPREFFTGQNILYSLVDLEKPSSSLATFTVNHSFFFQSPNELVVINKDGTFTPYNPTTGKTFKEELEQKRERITQEIRKKEEALKLEQQQIQAAEKRAREAIQQQKELQKAYPVKGNYFEQMKRYFGL